MQIARMLFKKKRHDQLFRSLREQLLQELESCRGPEGKGVPKEIIEKFKNEALEKVDASDLYKLEVAAYEYLSSHKIKLRLMGLRDMASNLTTPASYQKMQEHFNKKTDDDKENINEAYALASRMYRRYVAVPSVEELRTKIATKLLWWVLISSILTAVAAYAMGHRNQNNFWVPNGKLLGIDFGYWLALSSGICGAVVSTTIRIYKFDTRHEPLLTWLNLERGKIFVYVTPFLGMIFALIFLLVMHGGIIEGALFPNLADAAEGCWDNLHPVKEGKEGCTQYADISKIIIWCFLAGWSERLVPDVLDKLSNQASENTTTKD